MFGAAVAEWLSSWLTEQEVRGSILRLATWISDFMAKIRMINQSVMSVNTLTARPTSVH